MRHAFRRLGISRQASSFGPGGQRRSPWRSSRHPRKRRTDRRRGRTRGHAGLGSEQLEPRKVMAFDFVSAYAASDAPLAVVSGVGTSNITLEKLDAAPQQLTLRFSPGVRIDPVTLGSIAMVRSGGAGDGFGSLGTKPDVAIVPGSIAVNDLPNENQVVIRFRETLPDDSYRITIGGGLKTLPEGSAQADTFRNGGALNIDLRLDLGAFVVAVIPQPVSRVGGGLTQSRDTIDVYFNGEDRLAKTSAETPSSYRLFEVDRSTGADVTPTAAVNPTGVAYDAATGKAVLTFAPGAIADDKLYRLQVGAAEALVTPAAAVAEGSDDNSSFVTARDLGVLDATGKKVDGEIGRPRATDPTEANKGTFATPAGPLTFPSQFGTIDEPGHRQETFIPIDSHEHGLPGWATSPDTGPFVGYYNFKSNYGVDGQGNTLTNAITETQKQRAREVFELFSRYTGLRFIETADTGLTVVTGDVRALDPLAPPTALGGIAGGLPPKAIMNSLLDWGSSEYGGRYFSVAMHEIGHALGLAHSYDIPSIMGPGLVGEPVYPGDYDTIHLGQLYPAINSDVDTYRFTLAQAGTLSAETLVARPGQVATSQLDSLLTLYREDTIDGRPVRTMIARNDDSFGRDSFVGLQLEPGTYFVAVSSTGNDAFNPEVSDSGYGGRSAGAYQLKLGFQPRSTAATTIADVSGTLLDGDRDGTPGGAFNFWFNTASAAKTVFVDKAAAAGGNGSAAQPYTTIAAALSAVNAANAVPGSKTLVRIVGNTAGTGGTVLPYLVGTDLGGRTLADGVSFNVPKGVTVMIDEGAVIKLRATIVDVGSSSPLVDRAGAALQVLGTPSRNVIFSSYHDDTVGTPADSPTRPGGDDGVGPPAAGGQWGGIVLRKDSDSASKKAFVNSIANASIRYGGGRVLVDSVLDSFAPIQLESTRPTIAFNTITDSAGAAIAADPNSFEESDGRVGPDIRGNRLVEVRPDQAAPHQNSTNGLFVKIRTSLGQPLDRLDVPARFKSTDIVYVIQENLLINGGVGGYVLDGGDVRARLSGRLRIDPGVVVKLQGSRIELERGTSQLIAEGTANQPVIFTSLGDIRYGAGGTFDTNGNLPDDRAAGDWGGIVLNAGAKASIDYAYVAFGGGRTAIEGSFDNFNVIETHQGDLRVAHSRIENNAAGTAGTSRNGRGTNAAATIFVRGAQPVILDNDFRGNRGAAISANANALTDIERPDPGRSTGRIERDARYDDNRGPLVRGNRLPFDAVPGSIGGLQVRGEQITVESVWDDTDIVHVLQDEIIVQNFHTATGVRLASRPDASLIVKLAGGKAGLTASGYQLDIEDRIGGTVQIVGQPGYPVILTSLKDDTVGASIDPLGRIVKDTGNDGTAAPAVGDWRSLRFEPYSNDRNVAVVQEAEKSATGGIDVNGVAAAAQQLGVLAPNFATGTNSTESAQEKSGDENRRLGFEVHGRIATDSVSDVDVYGFVGYSGSEVWIDLDKTSPGLDSMLELLDASGTVLARSADGQTDTALESKFPGFRGEGTNLKKDPYLGGDFYTLNPKDAGMRVILPGLDGNPVGTLTQYFVRVRSQPRYEPATTGADNGGVTATAPAAYEADLVDPAKVTSGATNGAYELRIRLRQHDEKPGSTVRYADIRYPTIGIDVLGLPRNSQLTGETGETSAPNDAFGSAQYVGNLLQSDRGTISIAGQMASATDVDWYTFALNFEQIQSIGGVNGGTKTWATVFDLDYGDGFRGDLNISVFSEDGELIYVGRDSNVASDQPGAGQGNDFDDTSRGSLGKLDPFIGPAHLPAGNPTGSGSVEGGAPATPPDPSKQLRYYVAVSSNQRLPAALDAFFKQAATNSLIRLEPVNSIRRIAEDHIAFEPNADFDGYLTGPDLPPLFPARVTPQQQLFDASSATSLSLHATPFTLSDVTLFVYTSKTIETVDAMRGGSETTLTRLPDTPQNPTGDIAMRSDGKLFSYRPGSNAGMLYTVNTVTGAMTLVGDDNIPTPPVPPQPVNVQETLAATELGGTRSTFQLANSGVQRNTVNGVLRYTDSTGGVGGTAVTYTWSFTANANGEMTFTNVPTPAPPAGFPEPLPTGAVTVGTLAVKPTATINWSSPIDISKLQMSIQYSYQTPVQPNDNAVNSTTVDALAFRRVPGQGEPSWQAYYSVRDGNQSRLYRANAMTGDAATGRIGTGTQVIGGGALGVVTGLAFVNDSMYGVDTNGNFFRFEPDENGPTLNVTILQTSGEIFQGLTTGPQNLQGGAFRNMLFAISGNGSLRAFETRTVAAEKIAAATFRLGKTEDGVFVPYGDVDWIDIGMGVNVAGVDRGKLSTIKKEGNVWVVTLSKPDDLPGVTSTNLTFTGLKKVFDSDKDGIPDETSIATGVDSGAVGLAFSPLDINLWHPTVRRGRDDGHGINISYDHTRDALDDTKFKIQYQTTTADRTFLMEEGGSSMYFGLEKYVRPTASASTPYLNYESVDGQLGVLAGQWQQDLTSAADTMIAGTYNLPGGAYGSLITNSFSLAGSAYTDKPTLYFNYWLETENAAGAFDQNDMRDSARVFISADGGPWQVVASNNSTRSEYRTDKGELPNFVSANSALTTADNQHVQELYDNTGGWRQARIDVGKWAGKANLRLRFDFSTAGELDPTQQDAKGNLINDIAGYAGMTGRFSGDETTGAQTRGANNAFEGFYIDDVIIGHAERGEMVTGAKKTETNFFDIFTPNAASSYLAEQSLTGPYQLEIRRGTEYGVQPDSQLADVAIVRQFDTNDDLVVSKGYLGDANQPRQQGQFLIEANSITAAKTYGISIDAPPREAGTNNAVPGATRNLPVLSAARLVPGVVVTNNVISGSGTAGILFSGDTATNPVAAVPYGRIVNNTIYGGAIEGRTAATTKASADVTVSAAAGIRVGMIVSGAGIPAATSVVSLAGTKITLSKPADATAATVTLTFRDPAALASGISVTENAAPTVLNNLFANLGTGIGIDASSQSASGDDRTVVGLSAYYQVTTPVTPGVVQTQDVTLPTDPFVNAAARNFYLSAGSSAIDSAINTLPDRATYVNVTSVIGMPESPVVAPDRDIYGQLRSDDPGQASFPGLGSNVFKDRGAVERVDFAQPFLALVEPLDGSMTDLDPVQDSVLFKDESARGVTRFVLQINDNGVGIDRASVTSAAFALSWNGTPLLAGTNYTFLYLENDNKVIFEAPAVFGLGDYTITATTRASVPGTAGLLTDLANNTLLPNRTELVGGVPTAVTKFTITLADALLAPTNLAAAAGDRQVTLSWTKPANEVTVTDYIIQFKLASDSTWSTFTDGISTATTAKVTGLTNGLSYDFRVAAKNDVETGPFSSVVTATPYPPPVLTLVKDTGAKPDDGVTRNRTIGVSGLQASADWEYSYNGGRTWLAGTRPTGTVGSFILPQGTYPAGEVLARQTNLFGSPGPIGANPSTWVTDITPPAAPTVALAADTGASANDGVTRTGTVNVAGLETAATWEWSADDGANWTPGTGTSFTLLPGAYQVGRVQVRQTDLAGNGGPTGSNTFAIVVDVTPPAVPIIALLRDTGASDKDNVTRNRTIVVSGLEPNAAWEYSTNGGASWLPGSGSRFNLPQGTYAAGRVLVRQIDLAGNQSPNASNPATWVIDITPPAAPTLALFRDTGASDKDNVTRNRTIVVSGLEPNAAWEYSTNGGASWLPGSGSSFNLPQGTYAAGRVLARQTDLAGNLGTTGSNPTVWTIDITPPAAPIFALASDTGAIGSDGVTQNGTVNVTGIEPNATWQFSTNGGATWSNGFGGTFSLPAGTYPAGTVRVRQTDLAGLTGAAASNPAAIVVDAVAPTVAGLTSTLASGSYGIGTVIPVQVLFSEPVDVAGTPSLLLNTAPGRSATYASGSGTATLTFLYTVQIGDVASVLDAVSTSALSLNGGTIRDRAGNDATLSLPVPGGPGSLAASRTIAIDGAIKLIGTSPELGRTPETAPSFGAPLTSINLTFNAPVTGFTVDSLKLFFEGRSVSTIGIVVTGSGSTYTISIPSTSNSLRGLYRLDIGGPLSGIVSGSTTMDGVSSVYWRRV